MVFGQTAWQSPQISILDDYGRVGAPVQGDSTLAFRVIGVPGKQVPHANSMDRRTGARASLISVLLSGDGTGYVYARNADITQRDGEIGCRCYCQKECELAS